jgi:CcmD family protein
MEHLEYLFAAYSSIFILIGLYVIFIGRRQARLEREIIRLEASLRAAEQAAPPSEQRAEDS